MAQGTNKYYPIEWTPDKGNINAYNNSHPLGKRAKKIDQGILVVRFEMPYNVFCGGCDALIGKGTRFNAEKKAAGKYYSTTIWNFTMKCAACAHQIVVQADPQLGDYVFLEGCRKRAEQGDVVLNDETKEKIQEDSPFARLEKVANNEKKALEAQPSLDRLIQFSMERAENDYANNRLLKKNLKEQNAQRKTHEEQVTQMGLPTDFELGETTETDRAKIRAIKFAPKVTSESNQKVALMKAKSNTSKATKEKALLEKVMKRGMDVRIFRKKP